MPTARHEPGPQLDLFIPYIADLPLSSKTKPLAGSRKPARELRPEGWLYGVIDGRDSNKLAHIIEAYRSVQNGWLIVDGGGNQPKFDKTMAAESALCLLPFRNSSEDTDSVWLNLQAIPTPFAWPTNIFAKTKVQDLLDDLIEEYPDNIIQRPIDFVNSSNDLLARSFDTPSIHSCSVARITFSTMVNYFERERRLPNVTPIRSRAEA